MNDDPLVGRILDGRYHVRHLLGNGGMADVYEVWDNKRATLLAAKVLRRSLTDNRSFVQQFRKEAEMLRRLEHPNIVRIFEFVQDRDLDLHFITMALMKGGNLRQNLNERHSPFPPEEITPLLSPVASALHFAHQQERPVIHCDMKPSNVLMDDHGTVCVGDFGVAHLASQVAPVGTPAYMAPEQFAGEQIDPRTDVYSLGVVVYELATSKRPFSGERLDTPGTTPTQRLGWEHINQPPPPPRHHNPHLSSAIEEVILRALEKEPGRRFATTLELARGLEEARLKSPASPDPTWQLPDHDDRTIFTPRHGQPQAPLPQPADKSSVTISAAASLGKPHLAGLAGQLAGKAVVISLNEWRIGRSAENDLRLTHPSVSRHHATILKAKNRFILRDEQSTVGTFVNGRSVANPIQLHGGDIIQFGREDQFEFREGKR